MKDRGRGYLKYPESYNEKISYFDGFMDRYSQSHWSQKRNQLLRFTLYLEEKRKKKVLNADVEDVIAFFEVIDNEDLVRSTKNKWRHILNAYYNYVKEIKEKIEKQPYINPVPSVNLFDFKEKSLTLDDIEKEEDLLTYPLAERILNYLYFTRKKIFMVVSLLLYSGARISEVCKIELKNIDYEERFFFTKVKSRKYLNRWGVYFFPKFYVTYLKEWIQEIEVTNPNSRNLFEYKGHSINPKSIRVHLRSVKEELGLSCKMNPHAFRDLINSERFDTAMKEKYRFLLLNQTPPNVNVKHYLKKYKMRKKLLSKYDEFFPFPEFKPKINLM